MTNPVAILDWMPFWGTFFVSTGMARIVMARGWRLLDLRSELWYLMLAAPIGLIFAIVVDWGERVLDERRRRHA
jgi:hypothetical protein